MSPLPLLLVWMGLMVNVQAAPVRCLNNEGNDVGWWLVIKEQQLANVATGLGYWYYEGNWDPNIRRKVKKERESG